jgi:divalent metal cation (Fe/Co/Zn/Cd) transporter
VPRDPENNNGSDHAYIEQSYHSNIRQAAQELLDRKAKDTPVETLRDIIRAYQQAHDWIKRELGFLDLPIERAT